MTRAILLSALVACLVGQVPTGSEAAPALDGAYTYGASCEEVFVHRGKAASFKKPVDLFAPGFIISGTRLRTPMASCRIGGRKSAGARQTLKLSCATSIAESDVTAYLEPTSDGKLKRYSGDSDTIGTLYNRCGL
jgi:hypothetical protein